MLHTRGLGPAQGSPAALRTALSPGMVLISPQLSWSSSPWACSGHSKHRAAQELHSGQCEGPGQTEPTAQRGAGAIQTGVSEAGGGRVEKERGSWPRGRGAPGLPRGVESAQTKAEVRGTRTKSSAPEACSWASKNSGFLTTERALLRCPGLWARVTDTGTVTGQTPPPS